MVMTKKHRVTMALLALITLSFAFERTLAQQKPSLGASPEWGLGNRNAPVVIEVFSDYQCRRCATYNGDVKKVQAKYGDKVRLVFRQFPITQIHGNALIAAQAAEAAGLQGKFFEMNDMLYAKANEWGASKNLEEQFISYARDLKLDLKQFRADISGQQVRERVRLDAERAQYLNLPGTPTVVVNGELKLHEDLADLDSAIKARLKALKQ